MSTTPAAGATPPIGEGEGDRSTRGPTTTVLNTTPNHPFWDATTGQWTNAADLTPGQSTLIAPDGTTQHVTAVDNHTRAQHMRDLTVDHIHTYYVVAGSTPVLVHNVNCPNAEALRANMEARGEYATGDFVPHHIIPGGSFSNRNSAARAALSRAQAQLDRFGIDIDDADNGVYLPHGAGQFHNSLHTNNYLARIDAALQGANSADEVRAALRGLGQDLHYEWLFSIGRTP